MLRFAPGAGATWGCLITLKGGGAIAIVVVSVSRSRAACTTCIHVTASVVALELPVLKLKTNCSLSTLLNVALPLNTKRVTRESICYRIIAVILSETQCDIKLFQKSFN